jgi:hypothetical protein
VTSHDNERSERVRGTHCLDSAERRTTQHMGRGANEGHSHSGEGRGRYKLGHGNEVGDQGALTSWRGRPEGEVMSREKASGPRGTHPLERGREGQIRIRKEWQAKGTYVLESTERGQVRAQKESERGGLTS